MWDSLQRYKEQRRKGNGFGYSLFGPGDVARTLSARYYKDGSGILIAQEGSRPRRRTPREYARLMGFDGPGGAGFKIPVSDMQAYRQFGNAAVVPAVRAVARLMKPHIEDFLACDESELASARQMEFLFARASVTIGASATRADPHGIRNRMASQAGDHDSNTRAAARCALDCRGLGSGHQERMTLRWRRTGA